MSQTFVMKGYVGDCVHAVHCTKPLDIRGSRYASGNQPVGEDEGAPQWVFDLLKNCPDVDTVALSGSAGGVVYSRAAA